MKLVPTRPGSLTTMFAQDHLCPIGNDAAALAQYRGIVGLREQALHCVGYHRTVVAGCRIFPVHKLGVDRDLDRDMRLHKRLVAGEDERADQDSKQRDGGHDGCKAEEFQPAVGRVAGGAATEWPCRMSAAAVWSGRSKRP